MTPLPKSSQAVLRILGTSGAMTHKDIVSKSHYSPRTVRYALKKLKERELLIEKMNLQDMRQIIYQYRLTPLLETERVGTLTLSSRTNRDFWRVQSVVPRGQH
jgi:repressor of nif and glnA expression